MPRRHCWISAIVRRPAPLAGLVPRPRRPSRRGTRHYARRLRHTAPGESGAARGEHFSRRCQAAWLSWLMPPSGRSMVRIAAGADAEFAPMAGLRVSAPQQGARGRGGPVPPLPPLPPFHLLVVSAKPPLPHQRCSA